MAKKKVTRFGIDDAETRELLIALAKDDVTTGKQRKVNMTDTLHDILKAEWKRRVGLTTEKEAQS